jgi:hypothetical protein
MEDARSHMRWSLESVEPRTVLDHQTVQLTIWGKCQITPLDDAPA